MGESHDSMDLTEIAERLDGQSGSRYWRSLGELADSPEFRAHLEDEFPNRRSLLNVDRRGFMRLMGASLALAGLSGCRFLPQEKIVPYVDAPEQLVPGKPLWYASTALLDGYGLGVLVESHEGRPTKIEGNPEHPASLGATDAITQAMVLDLYDPDRARTVTNAGRVSSWEAFAHALRELLQRPGARNTLRLRLLTGTITSPTLGDQIAALKQRYTGFKWHQYDPITRDSVREGARLAFGEPHATVLDFSRADTVVAFDADFLASVPGSVRYARDFMARRKSVGAGGQMNRLYAFECVPSITGAAADHRQAVNSDTLYGVARHLAHQLGVPGAGETPLPDGVPQKLVSALLRDLESSRGKSIVVVGERQPAALHALCHAINHHLGNVGATVRYIRNPEVAPVDQHSSLRELVADMQSGNVDVLIVAGVNPVYDAPADLDFRAAMSRVPFRARLSTHFDETARECHWHVPEAHFLEAWGDARTFDGTASIVQPLVAPLYDGKSIWDLLDTLLDRSRPGYDIVRDYWRRRYTGTDYDAWFQKALHDGVLAGFGAESVRPQLRPEAVQANGPQAAEGLELHLVADPAIHDGRFANNGWLQELPKPLTKLVWDNAIHMGPATAQRLKLNQGDMVEVSHEGRSLRGPVFVQPCHPADVISTALGFGRTSAGKVGNGVGFSAYALRGSAEPWILRGVSVKPLGYKQRLVTTQEHHAMEGRDILRVGSLADLKENPSLDPHASKNGHAAAATEPHGQAGKGHGKGERLSLYNEREHAYDGPGWGMSIDLTACIGCNACVVACQAENNIPVVGKGQVAMGREMHWIRLDRYYGGKKGPENLDQPETHFQPVMCLHCENAPCEPVCPVAATVHSAEGLNQMVYNRCVGTRYCSNNCPYKVRRFNFLNYANHHETPVLKLLNNPNVTVRGRGVMEKCTYCVQRINSARIEAKKQGREVRDGEIVTACQQVCPTRAIVFGNIRDPKSAVSKERSEPRTYSLLDEHLNTAPRTTYLAKVTNPNEEAQA